MCTVPSTPAVATPSDGTMRGSGGGLSPSILNRMRKISIAYPSSVHLSGNWSANPLKPWRRRPLAERPYLMMFGGSMHGSPLAERLRKHIARMCEEYAARHGPLACKLVTAEHNFDAHLGLATQVMQQSRFCLEPPGFGDERKAIVDALTLGCIPVTFLPRVEADLWATHWSARAGGGRAASSSTTRGCSPPPRPGRGEWIPSISSRLSRR